MGFENKMILIRNYDLWSNLTQDEVDELSLVHNFKETKKGDYIYFDAQYHNKLYFLKDGYIKLGYIDDKGNEVVKEILQQGEVFGQFTLEKNNLQGEFAKAYKEDVSLCAFSIDDFEMLLKKNPRIALEYSKKVGNKLLHIQNRLQNLLHKDVRARLLNFLYDLVQQNVDELKGSEFCISNFLTHEDIANLIGSSRQTVTTLINEFADEGLIKYDRSQICFLDFDKLKKQISF